MNIATYLLENKLTTITEADFAKLTSFLEEIKGVGVNFPADEKHTAYIFYEESAMSNLRPKLTLETDESSKIRLETVLTDGITGYIVNEAAQKLGMKVFFENLGCYLPKAHFIHDCLTLTRDSYIAAEKVMLARAFTPIFFLENSDIFYAKLNLDGSIHIINENLLHYFSLLENTHTKSDEFNYKVADNLEDFVRKFDAELIPTNFYKYYKKSFKIMNYSEMDIENPGRKIFVKPYILEYDSDKIDFFKIANDNSALIYMDKIREAENLNKTILRILRDELKIANDYIGAGVAREIEFDMDKNDILTPRLIVKIYVNKANLTPEQAAKKNRTWISPEQVKDFNRK